MTPDAVLRELTRLLTPRYGAGEAASVARIVAEDAFSWKKQPLRMLSEEECSRWDQVRVRLLAGEPVQYVLGEADFFGLKYRVSPAVLIPRQETEELVAWVLEHLHRLAVHAPALLDVGLGSGCIGITLAQRLPALRLYGWEKSPDALALAQGNARRLLPAAAHPPVLCLTDVLDAAHWPPLPPLDVVVSNPPYITRAERHLMPEHVLAHEPSLALFVDDADALLFYRAIAALGEQRLKPGGAIFFECNEYNAPQVAALLQQRGWQQVALRQDLSGAHRMVGGRWEDGKA